MCKNYDGHVGSRPVASQDVEEYVGILRKFTRTDGALIIQLELGPVTIRAQPDVISRLQKRMRRLLGEPMGLLRVVDEKSGEAVWRVRRFHK